MKEPKEAKADNAMSQQAMGVCWLCKVKIPEGDRNFSIHFSARLK